MRIGVVGLGLIGGSIAKALTAYTDHEVFGVDTDEQTITRALEDGVICEEGNIERCEVIYICLHPYATVKYIRTGTFHKGAIVTDVCGIKRYIRNQVEQLLNKNGLRYVGSHPMAGREVGGYVSSRASLFKGASYIFDSG